MYPFFSVSLCVVDKFQHITPISFVESAVPENTKGKIRRLSDSERRAVNNPDRNYKLRLLTRALFFSAKNPFVGYLILDFTKDSDSLIKAVTRRRVKAKKSALFTMLKGKGSPMCFFRAARN